MRTIEQNATDLFEFANNLRSIGLHENTIAETIRLCGDSIPVWGQQLPGHYDWLDGTRSCHTASPGMYRVMSVNGNVVTIKKDGENCFPFVTGSSYIRTVLSANLECFERGYQP